MTKQFLPPPLDGSLVITEIVDWHSRENACHPLFRYRNDHGVLTHITWGQAVSAIYRVAHALQEIFPVAGIDQRVVGILAATGMSPCLPVLMLAYSSL